MSKPVSKHKHNVATRLVVAYVLLVVAIALTTAVMTAHGSFVDALRLSTTHQPETFTELYFVNPGKLPTYAATGKVQTVEFRIQNHLTKQHTYTYHITATGPVGNIIPLSGNVTLYADKGVTLPLQFTATQPGKQITITINLVGTQQQLTLRSQS